MKSQEKGRGTPAEHHIEDRLVGVADDRLPDKRCGEEGPEGHEEMTAADAAQIECDVRVRSHEEDAVEACKAVGRRGK
jgi:hypothetical protein